MADQASGSEDNANQVAPGAQAGEIDGPPAWLQIKTCVGLAVAVALIGLVASRLVPASPLEEHDRQYVQWLRKLRAVEEICGRRVELNPGCWQQHPLPPDPTGIWGK